MVQSIPYHEVRLGGILIAYVKNEDPWAAGDLVTPAYMDNFEIIYTESASYLSSHTHDGSYYTKAESEAKFWYAGNDGPASGSDADLIYKSTGNLHAASFAGAGVPTGLVVMWYGAYASPPSGWHVCDGTGGTINLRDKMVLGAGSTYSPGDTGGSKTFTAAGTITVNSHTLTTAEMGQHRHPFDDYYYSSTNKRGGGDICSTSLTSTSGTTSAAGGGGAHGHSSGEGTAFSGIATACMPYYHALTFIQKT